MSHNALIKASTRRHLRRETTTHVRLRSTGHASGRSTDYAVVTCDDIVTLLRNTAS